MVPSYGSLETIQLLSETSFSKIKNKKVIWGGTLKWDTLYVQEKRCQLQKLQKIKIDTYNLKYCNIF